jgi:putative membrane protein
MNLAQTIPLADTWMHGGWGWGWMSLMMVMMVLFWGAVIFGVVWLIRGVVNQGGSHTSEPPPRNESPIKILERRLAEGEMSEEDYRARREVLADRGEPLVKT